MATTQTYQNHAHRPMLTYAATACLTIAIVGFLALDGRQSMAVGLGGLIACNFVLIAISRVYITNLQDRIIRLEMRVRAAGLLTPEQQQLLAALSIKHVAALRFASDAELPALCERAARERLSPDDIKRAVTGWQADLNRT